MEFDILNKDGKARTGIVKTRHGNFHTPAFTPVATLASVRSLDQQDLINLDAEVVLSNTYHLHLRPGDMTIKRLGGLHKFMNWKKPIITDSGGFQAFSLGYGMEHGVGKIANNIFTEDAVCGEKKDKWATIDDDGVVFKSHVNGDKVMLNPKISMKIQSNLGSDIIFAFDECTSPLSGHDYTKKAMERTHKWALECLRYYDKKQALFGIVQGGYFKDLRIESAKFISKLPFDGFGVGGSLGKTKQDMINIFKWTIPLLPEKKPRHLLGIGAVEDIFNAVEHGIDMFDCVAPTRWGRRGHLYIGPESGGNVKNKFRLVIDNAKFKEDKKPIDPKCSCYVCKNYSRAYLNHLYRAKEISYHRLGSYHNEHFILRLMEEIRAAINKGKFKQLKKKWIK
jgi:queuine tRNA-ribosyltransferase/7-cyano-7-deazaguanine tRNA-ribosyltransferase